MIRKSLQPLLLAFIVLNASAQVKLAPNGYYTWKNGVYDVNGDRHIFRGFNYGGFDENSHGLCYGPLNCGINPDDFSTMARWGANIVRLPVNQTWWLNEEPVSGPWFSEAGLPANTTYRVMMDKLFELAKAAGLTVIADCHRAYTNGAIDKLNMATAETQAFWDAFSDQYKNDGQILFELLNEPRQITNDQWMNGGNGYVGMSALYNTIRSNQAHNLILVAGNDWAYDIRGIYDYPLPENGYNILIVSHTYGNPYKTREYFDERFGFTHHGFTANNGVHYQYPVIFTEFGYLDDPSDLAHTSSVINYAEENNMSWIPWSWVGPYYKKHYMFDQKYNADSSRTPNNYGSLFRDSLAYLKNKPMPARHADAPYPEGTTHVNPVAPQGLTKWSMDNRQLRFDAISRGYVKIESFSLNGARKSIIFEGTVPASGAIQFDQCKSLSGVCLIRLTYQGRSQVKQFIFTER